MHCRPHLPQLWSEFLIQWLERNGAKMASVQEIQEKTAAEQKQQAWLSQVWQKKKKKKQTLMILIFYGLR